MDQKRSVLFKTKNAGYLKKSQGFYNVAGKILAVYSSKRI